MMTTQGEVLGIERITNARRRAQAALVFDHIRFNGGKVIFDTPTFHAWERRTGLAVPALIQALDDLDDADLVRVKEIGDRLIAQLCIEPEAAEPGEGDEEASPPTQPRRPRFIMTPTRRGGRK